MFDSRSANVVAVVVGALIFGCGASEPPPASRGSSAHPGNSRGPNGEASAGQSGSPNRPELVAPVTSARPGTVCASALVQTARVMPTIVFVIDGSGSMCELFGDSGTRWQALRTALLDPSRGLIYRLQDSVSFGATLYDGTIDTDQSQTAMVDSLIQNPPCALLQAVLKTAGACPLLVEAPAKLGNAQAIDMIYPEVELGGSTPTDKAMNHVMDALIPTLMPPGPDGKPQGETYAILATDGAPNDICVGGAGGDGSAQRQGVIAAVDRGAAAGITTWVISLATGDPSLQAHLDEVARHGAPSNPDARTFSPTSPDELIMTLAQLLGGAVGCHVALNGSVTVGQECSGKVKQNGAELPCCQSTGTGSWTCDGTSMAAPNGWRLTDPHSIELLGDSCASFLLGSNELLDASFPCEVFTPD
jgi:hypothetical protein